VGRKKKFPTLEHIQIIDIAAEGKAIAKVDDLVIFVEGAIPGDIVTLQIIKKKKKYCEARIIDFEQYSSQRTNAFCKHFGICGGCKWQILPYPLQLEYKNKQVKDQLTRIGHVQIDTILPIVAAPKTTLYRNKLEFTFSNKRWLTQQEIIEQDHIVQSNALGFHVPKLFDKIVDIETCYLQEEPSNEIRNFIKEFAHIHNYSFFDIRNHNGLLRTLMIRSTTKGQVMVIVVFYEDNSEQRTALLQAIHEQFPTIHSLLYCINQKANDTIHDQDIRVFAGTDHIIEHMENLQFKIGPKSFYQTNSEQAYTLYCIARDFAQLQGNELVYDLYTGTGTIANFIASQARKVIGIEYVPEAIDDARENSIRNNISNTLFFAGDMKDVLNDTFIETHGAPDVIITDPPRAGMHQDVIDTILRCKPNRIVYVSCNPATQARDIQLLSTQYNVHKSQAVDMFPHTHHVENVTLLVKNT